jgi:uncharacterized membrane protein YphA (DoxX/SURF4 family)
MMRYLRSPKLSLVLRLALGVILVYTGIVKSMDLSHTAQAIENYRLLPVEWVNFVALLMPMLEIIVGVCLIAGLLLDGALVITTGMFTVFLFAIVSALMRGLDIDCGCFGTDIASPITPLTVLRNTVLLLAVVPIWMCPSHVLNLDKKLFGG